MTIWEEVYSKYKGSGNPATGPCGNQSLEEAYSQGYRPQSVQQGAEAAAPERPPESTTAPPKSAFVPRTAAERASARYPALLSKMRYSLSDSWANIMLESKRTPQTVLFCGASRKEGVTLISFHMAMFLSKEYNLKVLYVDTNLHHTTVPNIQNLPGLYNFVSEGTDLASLVVQTEYPGLYLLPSGASAIERSTGSNLLTRESITALFDFCRSHFDITIVDGQPLLSSPIMYEIAKIADMTLLVCRYGYSRQEVSRLAVEKLQKFGVSSIGVILNDRKFPVPQKLYKLMG